MLYRSCFLPAITYSFPATWMPQQFLERIHTLSTSTILNKMGLHSRLPRSVVFAPREIGGIDLCNLIYEQGTQQILILLRHLRAKTPLGNAIEGLIRTYQVWAGVPHHVLLKTEAYEWIPNHWLSHLRKTMHTHQIQIVYNSWTHPPLRQNDHFLMSDFADLHLPRHKLEKLNACRMHMQVTTLAEITDHTGMNILPQALLTPRAVSPKGLNNISLSTLQWPMVAEPSLTCWRLWTTTIRTLYTGSKNGNCLQQPLGPWLAEYAQHRFWHWRLHNTTHLMFQHSPDVQPRVALQTYRNRTLTKFSPTIPTDLPFMGPPVTPVDTNTGYVNLPIPPLPQPPTQNDSFPTYATIQKQFCQSIPQWQCQLYYSLRKAKLTNTLHALIKGSNKVMIVSDASVQKNGQSGFAWVLAHDAKPIWKGMGLAPGPDDDIYSGRAEAYGLLAAITFVSYYVSCYEGPFPPTTITCHCDNAGVITNLNSLRNGDITRPNDTTNDDRDLYLAIIDQVFNNKSISYRFQHVKGHQDKDPERQLTTAEQHNIECDRNAKQFVTQCPQRSTDLPTPQFDAAQPHLLIEGRVICRRVIPTLRMTAATPAYWDYLKQKRNWTHADLQSIHWQVLRLSLTALPRNDQRRIILLIHHKLPLRASKFHPHMGSKLCPSCRRENETAGHFLACQHTDRRQQFEKLRNTLLTMSFKYDLHPGILTGYWLGLTSVRNTTPYPDIIDDLPPELQQPLRYQQRIGWDQLYYGRPLQQWAQAIDQLHPHLATSGTRVMINFTQEVWKYLLATWTIRNQQLHHDAGQLSIPDYQQAVRTLYEMGEQLPPDARAALF